MVVTKYRVIRDSIYTHIVKVEIDEDGLPGISPFDIFDTLKAAKADVLAELRFMRDSFSHAIDYISRVTVAETDPTLFGLDADGSAPMRRWAKE